MHAGLLELHAVKSEVRSHSTHVESKQQRALNEMSKIWPRINRSSAYNVRTRSRKIR